VSAHVLRGRLIVGTFRRVRHNVGTCSAKLVLCRYLFSEDGLVSGLVLRGPVFVGMCSARLA